jgi:hypothetical protein
MCVELLFTYLCERHRASSQCIHETPQSNVPITHNSQQRRHVILLNVLPTSITKRPVIVRLPKEPDLL